MDYFNDFKVEKPEFQLLPEGEQLVRVIRRTVLNSFQQYSGQPKEDLPEWQNATPQLAITVVAAEEGKNGGLTHRFNGCGYRKYDELSEKEMKSDKYENVEGYACYKDKDSDLVRETDKDRTKSCSNILNQFAASLHIKEGDSLMEGIDNAILNKTPFRVTVTNELYNGRDQFRLNRYRAAAAVAVDDGFED